MSGVSNETEGWRPGQPLSPKAARFLGIALRHFDSPLVVPADRVLPKVLFATYVNAIKSYEQYLEGLLASGGLSEDDDADISNDLMLFEAVRSDLEPYCFSFKATPPNDLQRAHRLLHWCAPAKKAA